MTRQLVNYFFLNGELAPSEVTGISAFDRGFLYGDGLFETLRIIGGQPCFWDEHWERLRRGAEFLRIGLAYDSGKLRAQGDRLLAANACREGALRIHLSRGAGPRGYSPREAKSPVLVMSTHPLGAAPGSWKLATTSWRLPAANPLSALKTTNKLLHVVAKSQAEDQGADEGLLLSEAGEIAQGASSNVFWIEDQTVCTPPAEIGILPGITRAAILQLCGKLRIAVRQASITPEALSRAEGVFLTLSTLGVVEACSVDERDLDRHPITAELRNAFIELNAP